MRRSSNSACQAARTCRLIRVVPRWPTSKRVVWSGAHTQDTTIRFGWSLTRTGRSFVAETADQALEDKAPRPRAPWWMPPGWRNLKAIEIPAQAVAAFRRFGGDFDGSLGERGRNRRFPDPPRTRHDGGSPARDASAGSAGARGALGRHRGCAVSDAITDRRMAQAPQADDLAGTARPAARPTRQTYWKLTGRWRVCAPDRRARSALSSTSEMAEKETPLPPTDGHARGTPRWSLYRENVRIIATAMRAPMIPSWAS